MPSPSAPAAAPAPAASPAPASILDQLVETVNGVDAAILASVDGFGLARNRSMTDEASHPAMLAAAVGLAHQLVALGGGTQLRQLVVDHDGGLLLVWPIGDQRVLAVLAATSVDQRQVRSFVQAHAARLLGATP
jgi:predicted regulator of Ras-like GTPase activity (Roadblock/LC7/MglB family)